jgi:multidrug transporter EmrE-like cation transporter
LAWLIHGQRLNASDITGITLIVAGVVILGAFPKTVPH